LRCQRKQEGFFKIAFPIVCYVTRITAD
jgi:hypothetical protein